MMPSTKVLRKAKAVFGKSEREIGSLVKTVQVISKDRNGIRDKECGVAVMKWLQVPG